MSRKALKVVVEVKFRAVSCPGVHLPAKHDVYLSMCFMGQYCQSEDLPAVFPLLLHEKMTFEKIFRHAVDPGDITIMLEYETVRIELVQLILPMGDTLACFEEDARHFLFPEPKLVPSFSGVDREVLMTRASHFPGIAPRLEFSTKTTIVECSADEEINIYPNVTMRPVFKRNGKCSGRHRTSSPQKKQPQTLGRKQVGRKQRERKGNTRPLSQTPRSQSLSSLRAGNTQFSQDSAAPGLADWDPLSASQPMLASWPGTSPSALPRHSALFTSSPLVKSSSSVRFSPSDTRQPQINGLEYLKVNPALQKQLNPWTIVIGQILQHCGCLIENKLRIAGLYPVLTENGKKFMSVFEDCLRLQKLYADLSTEPQSLRLTGFWQKHQFLQVHHDALDRLWKGKGKPALPGKLAYVTMS